MKKFFTSSSAASTAFDKTAAARHSAAANMAKQLEESLKFEKRISSSEILHKNLPAIRNRLLLLSHLRLKNTASIDYKALQGMIMAFIVYS